jgi:hypothetical protein
MNNIAVIPIQAGLTRVHKKNSGYLVKSDTKPNPPQYKQMTLFSFSPL